MENQPIYNKIWYLLVLFINLFCFIPHTFDPSLPFRVLHNPITEAVCPHAFCLYVYPYAMVVCRRLLAREVRDSDQGEADKEGAAQAAQVRPEGPHRQRPGLHQVLPRLLPPQQHHRLTR